MSRPGRLAVAVFALGLSAFTIPGYPASGSTTKTVASFDITALIAGRYTMPGRGFGLAQTDPSSVALSWLPRGGLAGGR
jgi:hypothetical protein